MTADSSPPISTIPSGVSKDSRHSSEPDELEHQYTESTPSSSSTSKILVDPSSILKGMERLSPSELKEQGNSLFKEKKYAEAIEYYSRAIDIAKALENDGPTLVRLYSNRAACSNGVYDWDAAVRDAETAISMEPDFVKPYFHLQRAYKKLKRFQEAKEMIEKAQTLVPEESEELRIAMNEVKRQLKNTIEDYDVQREVGSGNYTSIFIAVLKKTGKQYALKIGDRDKVRHLKKGHELNREKSILERCNHENIIKLYENFIDESQIYMSLEYLDCELFDMVRKTGIAENLARHYLVQVLCGLSYLHSKEILHRDLKAENIMLDKKTGLLKIIDFGTAKDARYPELDAIVEKGPMRRSFVNYVGTPQFMSPECIRNKICSYPSDCYSFGCLIYQMLFGLPPYTAGSEYLVMLRVMNRDLDIPVGTSPEALNLMKACIQPKQKDRLTLDQIKQHPFFSNHGDLFLSDLDNIDPDAIAYFEKKQLRDLNVIPEGSGEEDCSEDIKSEEQVPSSVSGTVPGTKDPHESYQYFQRNPDIKRPVLPLTWHILRTIREGDEDMVIKLKKHKYKNCHQSQIFVDRFLQLDQWEREARPGQGPSAKVQAFLDAEMAKDKADTDSEEDEERKEEQVESKVNSEETESTSKVNPEENKKERLLPSENEEDDGPQVEVLEG